MAVEPTTLRGGRVRLEPLALQHAQDLMKAASRDEVWTYLDEPTPTSMDAIESLIREALGEQGRGLRIPFAVILIEEEKAIGSISYINIERNHRALEIGWAWLDRTRWQEGIGRESAYLLMHYAFEELGATRVVFKADARNARSRKTIESLGAVHEGVFRNHRILRTGKPRDSAFYSLIKEDWQAIRSEAMTCIGAR